MTNRDITISNNLVHDIGIDYRSHDRGFSRRTRPTRYITHNEAYNLPYSGDRSSATDWGVNDVGGSQGGRRPWSL